MKITDLDLFYISYDEPNAESNWADLYRKAPWANRVHGIKGFDAVHKHCAWISTMDKFITVDGDNIVDDRFFDVEFEEKEGVSVSWMSRNIINDLVYGNGGIKCWDKNMVYNMNSHENATSEQAQVDFCWESNYTHEDICYSTTYCNGSPYQAFRTGLREGVKMCLDKGQPLTVNTFSRINKGSLYRLIRWCSLGADVENGIYAILGARMGCHCVLFGDRHTGLPTQWDWHNIRDYDWIKQYWDHYIKDLNPPSLDRLSIFLGNDIQEKANLPIAYLDASASKFFKEHNHA